nr:AAA family ATPase [Pseudoduganella violacea]
MSGQDPFSDAANGIFLSAPRRTGKSTFLRNELLPALESDGKLLIYVDLWSDRKRDPAALIASEICAALKHHLPALVRGARSAGVSQLTIAGWLKIDPAKVGTIEGLTLPDALKVLHAAAGKAIVLIIDEAQHALSSEDGEATMMALKSARDQLNRPGDTKLFLIMSGSDRDKFLRLLNSSAAPFYGSAISKMPLLDAAFIAQAAAKIEAAAPHLMPVNRDKLERAFARFGHRPQAFLAALSEAANALHQPSPGFEDEVLHAAERQSAEEEQGMANLYLALRPLEQALVWRMLEQGGRFRPYDAAALAFYSEHAGEKASTAQIQNIIEALRSQSPSLVRKSAKGEYAIEDVGMYEWFQRLVAAGAWPPMAEN